MKNSTINATVETITPEMARHFLDERPTNRKIVESKVKTYIKELKNGNWAMNGESIILNKNGKVIDGQHRLKAISESGISATAVVVRNVDENAIETIDTGSNRTAAHVLEIKGMSHLLSSTVSAAARLIIAFDTNNSGFVKLKAGEQHLTTNKAISKWVENNSNVLDSSEFVLSTNRIARPLPASALVFLHFLMQRAGWEQEADDFIQGLVTGAGLGEHDPRLVLRTRLQSDAALRRIAPVGTRISWALKAIKWYLEGRDAIHPGNMLRVSGDEIALSYKWAKKHLGQ